ncbi:hypothetical protein Nepgr_032573 [Nepenthes gracilis]|uniref:3-beta hydroxysteroid dehydrogenase/isomerase domain-containing protein n=1 Tax=Nepenthes gracilis TaxID=150966 RepID=A0AAD3TJM9_NEPGR|nr:hypothetical protein Nepgr_032573 [Nepenthes gracilis]
MSTIRPPAQNWDDRWLWLGLTLVVTGGLGFVGSALCLELLRRGARHVRSLDFRASSLWSHELALRGVLCIQGDVTCKKDVEKALHGADCVFHLASYGMSGKEMLQHGRIHNVNIDGTCHILEACIKFGIKRLVYVSTYNVVFGGNEIVNGNEALPYFPVDGHVDTYGSSKSIAEQLVLKSSGRPLREKGKHFYTCSIRPAAIYGPGEERHLPRIVHYAELGLLLFKIGETGVKTDWIYVDNLIRALLLASMGLLDDIPGREGHPIAAGQSYFVSDGSPMNTFEFIRPLLRSLEYDIPKASLTVHQALLLGRIFQALYTLLYPLLNKWWLPQPFILPAEVYKVGVTHYFSPLKAKVELGYVPLVSPRKGMAATISYWQERKRRTLNGPTIYEWLFCVIGMVSLFAVAFFPSFQPLSPLRAFALHLFRSVQTIRIVFLAAVAAHVSEATYAWHLAKRVDPANARGWFWQTLALGFPSLRLLLKKAKS